MHIILSLGDVNALIPIIIILILIAAAGGLTRNFDIFSLFGLGTLAGIGLGSRGSMASRKTGAYDKNTEEYKKGFVSTPNAEKIQELRKAKNLSKWEKKLKKYMIAAVAGTMLAGTASAINADAQNNTYVMRTQAANTLNKIISYAGSETVVEDYLLSGAIKSAKRGDYHESRIRLRDVFRRNYAKMNPLQNREVGIAMGYLGDEQALVSSYTPLINNKHINSYKYVKQEEKQQKNMDTEYIEVANQTYVKYNENNATVSGTTFSKPKRTKLSNNKSIEDVVATLFDCVYLATWVIILYLVISIEGEADTRWRSGGEFEKPSKEEEKERISDYVARDTRHDQIDYENARAEERRERERNDCMRRDCDHPWHRH